MSKETIETTENDEIAVSVPSTFSYYVSDSGEVIYVANSPDSFADIKADAANCKLDEYYIIGLHKADEKTAAVPATFYVSTNLVSTTIKVCAPEELQLVVIPQTSYFLLPKIPFDLFQKIETFFRKVDKDLGGSESIVVLAFDERFATTDPNGWRVIIPVQNNTSAYCNYDPISVNDSISDEDEPYIRLVGTVHSHPGMSAFASHTDANDQKTFDGLHITIGWTGSVSEYHVEIQAGGKAYKAPADLVVDFPKLHEEDFEEYNDWASRVSLKVEKPGPPVNKWSVGGKPNTNPPALTLPTTSLQTPETNSHDRAQIKIPEGCPSIINNIVVANLIYNGDKKCPVCKIDLIAAELEARRCRNCLTYIAYKSETIADVITARKNNNNRPCSELIPATAALPIKFWHRDYLNDKGFVTIEGGGVGTDTGPKVPGSQLPML